MPISGKSIMPCLWFDTQAEDAAKFYCSVFRNSKITAISRYPEAGQDIHHKPAGSVMVVAFEIDGMPFTALNGGPNFKFDEAVSFQILCETQADIDYYWAQADRRRPGRSLRLVEGQVRPVVAGGAGGDSENDDAIRMRKNPRAS